MYVRICTLYHRNTTTALLLLLLCIRYISVAPTSSMMSYRNHSYSSNAPVQRVYATHLTSTPALQNCNCSSLSCLCLPPLSTCVTATATSVQQYLFEVQVSPVYRYKKKKSVQHVCMHVCMIPWYDMYRCCCPFCRCRNKVTTQPEWMTKMTWVLFVTWWYSSSQQCSSMYLTNSLQHRRTYIFSCRYHTYDVILLWIQLVGHTTAVPTGYIYYDIYYTNTDAGTAAAVACTTVDIM